MHLWKRQAEALAKVSADIKPLAVPENPQRLEKVDLMTVVAEASNLPANQATEALDERERKAQRLKSLGLLAVSAPILEPLEGVRKATEKMGRRITSIPEANIRAFLRRLLPEGGSIESDGLGFYVSNATPGLFFSPDKQIFAYRAVHWQEVEIEKYTGIPPNDVLDKLEEAQTKKAFDYYTIASVETKVVEVKDPLLFGRYKNDSNRYFLAQWGEDVSLDDII